jgi:hypothetical protein
MCTVQIPASASDRLQCHPRQRCPPRANLGTILPACHSPWACGPMTSSGNQSSHTFTWCPSNGSVSVHFASMVTGAVRWVLPTGSLWA